MPSKELEDIFCNLSTWGDFFKGLYSPENWRRANVLAGARKFKHEVLGFLDFSCVKDPQEMVKLFCKLKMVSSREEGEKLLPLFANQRINYTVDNYLQFTLLKGCQGEEFYRIEKGEGKD